MLSTGKMDARVELQSKTQVNELGQMVTTWNDEGAVWARVVSQKGSEAFESARENARETIRVGLRYRDDINTGWRLIYMDEAYSINYVDRSNRRQGEIWVTAELIGEGDRPFEVTYVYSGVDQVVNGNDYVIV